MAGLHHGRSAALISGVHRASDLLGAQEQAGIHRILPVSPALRPLLPGHGLRRGTTIAVRPAGSTSLLLALLAEASRTGSWCAVVGLPTLGAAAAAELGIALDRLALVPYPGPEWVNVVTALVDGVDLVAVAPPGPVPARTASQLAARARQRGCVLVPLISSSGPSGPSASAHSSWEGVDLVLEPRRGIWEGLGQGHGRLRRREVTVSAYGRGAAAHRRQVKIWLPATPGGWLAPETTRPTGRPALTVIDGGRVPDAGSVGEAV